MVPFGNQANIRKNPKRQVQKQPKEQHFYNKFKKNLQLKKREQKPKLFRKLQKKIKK